MDGWKGHRSRRMGILCFKKKLFAAKEKGGIKEVPGRYGILGEDGWSRGVNQSEPGKEKRGIPILVSLKSFAEMFTKKWR